MQEALLRIVRERSPHFIPRGEVITYSGESVPYRAVLHAVAIDGWYESSPEIIQEIVTKSLRTAAGLAARRVALAALATGFGHLSLLELATGVRPLTGQNFNPIKEVCIRLLEDYRVKEPATHFPEATVVE